MTIIKSEYSSKTLNLTRPESTPGNCLIEINHYNGDLAGSINIPTSDLRAALGVDSLGCGCDEADENLKAAIARAEKAEATIARVKELRVDAAVTKQAATFTEYTNQVSEFFYRLDAALASKPALTIPTEAGAVIEYTDHEGGRQRWFRTRDTQRPWVDREGNTWHDAGVENDIARDFTVLIEPEP